MKEKNMAKKKLSIGQCKTKTYDWLLQNKQESMFVSYKIFKAPTENPIDLLLLQISKFCSSGLF